MTVLIEPTTEAATSSTINFVLDHPGTSDAVAQGYFPKKATLRVTGGVLGTDEYVKMQYSDGTNWIDAETEGNDGKILDVDNAVKTIFGRMPDVRLVKSATTPARGVEVV